MQYYPKSRIIINLVANPNQFTTINGKPYTGPYYTTFDGKSFTGKSPYKGTSQPLINVSEIIPSNPNTFYKSNEINHHTLKSNSPVTLIDPTPFTPSPTEVDYQVGKITRYIARQRNGTQFKVMEIDKQTHENLTNLRNGANYALWKSIPIFWQISGPLHNEKINNITTRAGIIDTNQRILDNAEKNFIGIKQYLSDLKQFSRVN